MMALHLTQISILTVCSEGLGMNQLTTPVLTMSSRDIADQALDAQIEPLNFEGIVNSTTPNLNPMGGI